MHTREEINRHTNEREMNARHTDERKINRHTNGDERNHEQRRGPKATPSEDNRPTSAAAPGWAHGHRCHPSLEKKVLPSEEGGLVQCEDSVTPQMVELQAVMAPQRPEEDTPAARRE
jgi:hypothetical protein